MIAKQSAAADCIILCLETCPQGNSCNHIFTTPERPSSDPLACHIQDSQKHQAIASKQGVVTYLLRGDLSSA